MGWTGIQVGKLTRKEKIAIIHDNIYGEGKYNCLAETMNGNNYFSVCENVETKEAFIAVVMTYMRDGEFFTKEMTESFCPCAYNCPVKYLSMCNPSNEGYAETWRDCVRAYWKAMRKRAAQRRKERLCRPEYQE